MAQHKDVAAETSEAMDQQFRPIAPKPMASSSPLMPISSTVWSAIGNSEVPVMTRGWCMPGSPLPGCGEHVRRLSPMGSSTSAWASSLDIERLLPMEQDLISKLQVPKVIKPHPTRPLRTTIYIDCSNIIEATNLTVPMAMSKKTAWEVVAELELPDALPAIVSGYNNKRVHLTNDAYKAMVGQPICPWLDSLPGTGASRRINGEVVLNMQRFSTMSCVPSTRGTFPCTARISWEHEDAIASLSVPCGVEYLTGNSADYCFIWRFDSSKASIMYCIT